MARSQKILLAVFLGAVLVALIYGTGQKTPRAKIVILSPHFDDAVLSLGGFVASQNMPPTIATFFAGEPKSPLKMHWDAISGFQNSTDAISRRTKENAKALAIVGAKELNFSYLDFQYRDALNRLDTAPIQTKIEKDVSDMINQNFKGEIDIYGPAEFGPTITHPDHQILHDAFTVVARRNLARKNVRFFFYEDFPYVSRYEASTTTPLKVYLEKKNSGVSLRETPLPLSTIDLDKKIEAVNAYPSQDKAFGGMGENIAAEAGRFAASRCEKIKPPLKICEVVYELH